MLRFETLRLEFDGDVANLILARPERLNAINSAMIAEIPVALDAVLQNDARCLLIRGEGRAFSSGGDLAAYDIRGSNFADTIERLYNPVVEKLFNYPLPIVSAVRGVAAGAGCALALAADFVVADRSAFFVMAFINVGLVADAGASWILTRAIGRARATEMLLLGERVSASKALEWGMIYRVVDDACAVEEAQNLARRLANGPTAAYGYFRKNIRAALEGDLSSALIAERDGQHLAGQTRDFWEALQAFKEKRPPVFVGK